MELSQVARLSEIISVIQAAEDRDGLASRTLDGFKAFGFDSFNISINVKDRLELVKGTTLSSFGDDFHDDYEGLKLYEIDPVMDRIFSHCGVFRWKSEIAPEGREKTLYEYLRSVPLTQGVVVPLPRKPGCVSIANVTSGTNMNYTGEMVHCVSVIARVAMMRAECLGLCADDTAARLGEAGLSARQIEILHWAAQGKSNGDIAAIVGQSKRAVDWHMSEILRKLKVASRSQAVALFGPRLH